MLPFETLGAYMTPFAQYTLICCYKTVPATFYAWIGHGPAFRDDIIQIRSASELVNLL